MQNTDQKNQTTSMFSNVMAMYIKDLVDTLRDRRNVLRMLLLPSLMLPLMGHFMLDFSKNYQTKSEEEVLNYSIVGKQYLPELANLYAKVEDFHFIELKGQDGSVMGFEAQEKAARDEVKSGKLQFTLIIPEDTKRRLVNGERISLTLVYNNSASSSEIHRNRASKPLEKFNERQRDWRLIMLGVSGYNEKKKLLDPVSYESLGTASDREIAGQTFGGIISYFIFLLCFTGCIFTAADLAAGEKERGSMETLLLTPVPRLHLVLGKYLVIFTMGIAYVTISLSSLSIWLIIEGLRDDVVSADILTMINFTDILMVWLMLFPIAAIFAATLLAISVYAKSFREATSMSSIANIIVILAAVVGTLPGIKLNATLSMIPVANVALAIKELVKGTLTDYSVVMAIVASTTVLAVVLLLFCTKMFDQEDIIFRE